MNRDEEKEKVSLGNPWMDPVQQGLDGKDKLLAWSIPDSAKLLIIRSVPANKTIGRIRLV